LLKSAGYATGFVGKWHMGGYDDGACEKRLSGGQSKFPGINQHGFDDAYFVTKECFGAHNHSGSDNDSVFIPRGSGSAAECIRHNDAEMDNPTDAELIDYHSQLAMDLMEKYTGQSKPFYIQLWYFVPHDPAQNERDTDFNTMYSDVSDASDKNYYSLVSSLDENIWKIVDKMEQLGIAENTLLFFTSDNGPAGPGKNGQLSGGKRRLREGGIRVPAFAYWKNHIPPKVTGGVSITNDLLPTFCEAAGVALPPVDFDGISILKHLTQNEPIPDRTLFFKKGGEMAVIENGKWRYFTGYDPAGNYLPGKYKGLFNLDTDIGESNDLSSQYPDKVNELKKKLAAWEATLPDISVKGDPDRDAYNGKWVPLENLPTSRRYSKKNAEITFSSGLFAKNSTICFTLPRAQKISLMLYDSAGRACRVITNRFLNAGRHTIPCEKLTLSKGVYHIQLKTEGNMITSDIVLR
jgi:N-acetylgalactosamine-6-sulfatase